MATNLHGGADGNDAPPRAPGWGWMLASGLFTLALGALSILLPLVEGHRVVWLVGWLLLAGGLGELLVGWSRHGREPAQIALVSGVLTALAGLLFVSAPAIGLFPASYFLIGWLLLRGLAVLRVALRTQSAPPPVRRWLLAWGVVDLALGLLLLLGLPIMALLSVVFGPNIDTVTSFGIVLALSFWASGLAFIAIALMRRGAAPKGRGR